MLAELQSSEGSPGLDVQDGFFTELAIDGGRELHWGSRQATPGDFSIWLGLFAAWWSQCGHAPPLTPGFLKAVALLPILFVRGVTEPARIQGNGTIGSTS